MAISLTESVKQLMLQFKFEMDVDSLNKNLICTICNKIMIDAYLSYCGCNYFHGCIVAFLEEENKYCLGGKEECKEEHLVLESNVVTNPRLNRTILKVKILCPNKPCPCITELINIEEHLRVCTLQSMECPFSLIGCENDEASKESILVHLRDDTLTHSQLLIELINSLKNEVRGLKEDFAKSKLEQSREKEVQMGEMRREMAEKYELEMENQKRETNGLKGEIARLKEECDEREIMMDGMKKEVATLKKEMEEVRECSRNIKNTVETSERKSTKYRDETRSTLTKMKEETDKKENTATVTQSMIDVRARVDKLAEIIDKVNVETNTKVAVGQSSFTVDKFSARKQFVAKGLYTIRTDMQIFVRTMDGKSVAIEIGSADKVSDLKNKIHDKLGLMPDEQKLICNGVMMEDEKKIEDYNIVEKMVINVVARLR